MIALLNTALTTVGMLILGVRRGVPGRGRVPLQLRPSSACSPLRCRSPLVALQHSGLGLLLAVVVMVIGVHMVEAYVLNPRSTGRTSSRTPLAVLVVLYLGEHLFGVWGLILGVPLATYVWRHLIKGEANRLYESEEEDGERSFYLLPPEDPAIPSFARARTPA
ncbi:MAG: AI-2E family transporter [Planctomycetota bacterium]